MKNTALEKLQQYDKTASEFYAAVMSGLKRSQRAIPPKYFYDETGSHLFDAICNSPEYYPTRTELQILDSIAPEIAEITGPGAVIIEPGCGSAVKVRILLDRLSPSAYVGMDISGKYLKDVINRLSKAYPTLTVKGLCNDFIHPANILDLPLGDRLIFFPGSTIGNFEPTDAVSFLKQMARLARSGGRLLIGVDLKKDPAFLNAAYNDSEGYTAAFNMNLLVRMNSELDANFQIGQFRHSAFYNERQGRVEMHLVSQSEQVVQIDNTHFGFSRNESIHTENSYKYSIKEFQSLARQGNFEPERVWTDPDDLFSLHLLRVV